MAILHWKQGLLNDKSLFVFYLGEGKDKSSNKTQMFHTGQFEVTDGNHRTFGFVTFVEDTATMSSILKIMYRSLCKTEGSKPL